MAIFVSEQCSEYALALYLRKLVAMQRLVPSLQLDVDAMAHATGYAPTRGRSSVRAQRFSPIGIRSPPKPAPPMREDALTRLSAENARLKAELATVRHQEQQDSIRVQSHDARTVAE